MRTGTVCSLTMGTFTPAPDHFFLGLLQVVPLVGLAANRDAGNRDFPGYGAKTLCCLRRGVRPKVQPGEILSRLCRRSSQAAENRK